MRFTLEQQKFIVARLGFGLAPAQVVNDLALEFGLSFKDEAERQYVIQQVCGYKRPERIGPFLQYIKEGAMEEARKLAISYPIAHKAFRLDRLQAALALAEMMRDPSKVREVLAEARAESAGLTDAGAQIKIVLVKDGKEVEVAHPLAEEE